MPDTTIKVAEAFLLIIALGPLIEKPTMRAPVRPDIKLLEEFYEDLPYGSYDGSCPQAEVSGQLATCGYYARYMVDDTEVAIENGAILLDGGDHLRFDVGRVVVDGDIVLTARDVKITTHGTVSAVHFSWLNTMNVSVIDGSATIDQGGQYFSTVTSGNAVTVDTLTPYDAISPTAFNLDADSVKAFYDWALQRE